MTRRQNPEAALQRAVVAHLTARGVPGLMFWHTPSGAFYGSKAQGAIMKAMGAKAGVPDLLLFYMGSLYALELKAPRGRLSEAQKAFLSDISRAGACAAVLKSLDEALEALETWGLIRPAVTMKSILQGLEATP